MSNPLKDSIVPNTDGKLSIGTFSKRLKNIYVVNGMTNTSDIREKTNISKMDRYGLDTVMKLQPVEFEWKDEKRRRGKKNNLGFIAQEIEELIPEVVVSPQDKPLSEKVLKDKEKYARTISEYEENKLGMYTHMMIPVLVNAIQEINHKIDFFQLREHPMVSSSCEKTSTDVITIVTSLKDVVMELKNECETMELNHKVMSESVEKIEHGLSDIQKSVEQIKSDIQKLIQMDAAQDSKPTIMRPIKKEVRFTVPLTDPTCTEDESECLTVVENSTSDDFVEFDTESSKDDFSEEEDIEPPFIEEVVTPVVKDCNVPTKLKTYYEERKEILTSTPPSIPGQRSYISRVKQLKEIFEKSK